MQRIIHIIGANYSTFVFKDFKLCIIELNFSFSIETCTHARKLTSRRNRNIYFARGKVHMYVVYTFFKATCFWIIMIRIYSLHIIQIFFYRINFFYSSIFFILLLCTYYFFAILRSFYALWKLKMLLSKVCYFCINHISRLRSVFSTYLADFSYTTFEKGEIFKLPIMYVYCAM